MINCQNNTTKTGTSLWYNQMNGSWW